MIPDKIYIPHNKTRYPQGMCVHWNRKKNKGNYDSDDDIEYIRADKPESAWEMFKRLNYKYGRCLDEALRKHFNTDTWFGAIIALQDLPEQKAINIMKEIERELRDGHNWIQKYSNRFI